jgi:hypothetical protein
MQMDCLIQNDSASVIGKKHRVLLTQTGYQRVASQRKVSRPVMDKVRHTLSRWKEQ